MSDIEFVPGLIVKRPENAPDYVLAKLSIKREELLSWLRDQQGEWINVECKRAKSGKCYAAVDTWKPEGKAEKPKAEPEIDDRIPF